jgi:O-antigen ligase
MKMTEQGWTEVAEQGASRQSDDRRGSAPLDRLRAAASAATGWNDGRLLAILAFGSGAIILAGLWSPLLSVAVAAPLLVTLAGLRPGWAVALALNGFFLYLAMLDITGHVPRTLVTGAYYAALGMAMASAIWLSRDVILARVRARTPVAVVWAAAAILLAAWFLVNAAVFREGGDLARNLAGLLVLSTLPAAALAFALRPSGIEQLRLGLVALGLLLVTADLVAFARGPLVEAGRFSPLEDLDPINAGLIPALAAMAAASFSPRSGRGYAVQAGAVAVLVAASLVPGSRGPAFSLVAAMLALSALRWRWGALVPLIATAAGLGLGAVVADRLGTHEYFAQGVEDVAAEVRPADDPPAATPTASPVVISTFSMRKHWFEDAWREFPERPVFGHGIATLRDTSPESQALGGGSLIYPHNDLAEAAYSLGVPGLVLFVVLIAVPGVLLLLRRGRRREARYALGCGVFAFAFLQSNVSGEIGADAALWSASALTVALYLDDRRTQSARQRV